MMKVPSENMLNGSFFNRTFKFLILAVTVCFLMYTTSPLWCTQNATRTILSSLARRAAPSPKYPLTDPVKDDIGIKYRIGVISDLDKDRSKVPGKPFAHRSYFKTGYLIQEYGGSYRVLLEETVTLTSTLNEKGRGLELSELCMFNERLYTVDDRTGVVFQLINNEPIPWVILQDGDGTTKKGFKSEWMTVKNGSLYVGSMGKERTTNKGEFQNLNPMFVKSIDAGGRVTHHNWTANYMKVRSKVGIHFPGYILHEAAMWSEIKQRWFFLPRRMSKLKYDELLDEKRNANVLLSATSDFSSIDVVYVGQLDNTHGFSSFKFIPGTSDSMIVALKTKEIGDDVSSYIVVFETATGKVVMDEQLVDNEKYEGIEFL